MRRWKIIKDYFDFVKDDIVIFSHINELYLPHAPIFEKYNEPTISHSIPTKYLVEIDDCGNTIRTYKEGDTLDEGVIINNENDKKENNDAITKISFKGIQIKSEEIFHRFCKSLSEIEELTGIHEVEIELDTIFFCPWIDKTKCRETPMEELIIDLIDKLKT